MNGASGSGHAGKEDTLTIVDTARQAWGKYNTITHMAPSIGNQWYYTGWSTQREGLNLFSGSKSIAY